MGSQRVGHDWAISLSLYALFLKHFTFNNSFYFRAAFCLHLLLICFFQVWLPLWLSWSESTCNAEDLGLIPGLGRSLEKGKATHSSILAWRIECIVCGVAKSWTQLSNFDFSNLARPELRCCALEALCFLTSFFLDTDCGNWWFGAQYRKLITYILRKKYYLRII